nr:hypothetical protein [Tanacetum cinerariifolium]
MAQPTTRNHAHRRNHKHYAPLTHQIPQKHMVPAPVLTQSKLVSITAVRPVSTAVPKTSVTKPKQVKPIVTKTSSSPKRHTNRSPSPKTSNSPPKVTAIKAPVVSAAQGSDESLSPSPIYDRYQSSNGYHAVPPPYIGTFMPPKPDLVFNNAPNAVKTDHSAFNIQLSPTKPDQDLSHTIRPSAPIIEDWVSDSEDE